MTDSVGDQSFISQEGKLQAAIGLALGEIDSRWWDCVRSPQSTSPIKGGESSPFFQLGKRLGQFLIQPKLTQDAVEHKLALLKETEVIRAKRRLNSLEAEAASILTRQLPQLEAEREDTIRRQQICETKRPNTAWQGSLLEILLYSMISIALFLAELSLATQVTQEALLLRNPWVFSIALACLTLAFKFLADHYFHFDETRSGVIYLIVMIVLFLCLMLPVSVLRTRTVLTNIDSPDDRMPGASEARVPAASVGESDRLDSSTPWYLNISFFLSSVLFPLLSGAGFSKVQASWTLHQSEKERRREFQGLRQSLKLVDESYERINTRLSLIGEEICQIIATMGNSMQLLAFYVFRLVDLLVKGGGSPVIDSAATALSKKPDSETLESFLTALRSGGPIALEHSQAQLHFDYYLRLLNAVINSGQESKLDLLKEQLENQIKAEVDAGFQLGKKTRYQLFAGEDQEELLRIADLTTYHGVFFEEEDADEDSQGHS